MSTNIPAHPHRPIDTGEPAFTAPGIATDAQPPERVSWLGLSHPKNYLGVPLAIAADGQTGAIVAEHLVTNTRHAKRGAQALQLVNLDGHLTSLGRKVVRTAQMAHEDLDAALDDLHSLRGSPIRFIKATPAWSGIIRFVCSRFGPAERIIDTLNQQSKPLTLPELVQRLAGRDPEFVTQTFFESDALSTPNTLPGEDCLKTPAPYAGTVTFQLKSILWHAGILTERGHDTAQLDPTTDYWALEERWRDA